jgi:malonate transporter and related proteins
MPPLALTGHGAFCCLFRLVWVGMSTFLQILSITAPIFALIGLGYITTRQGLFAKADMRVLGKFVLSLALPALIFRAMAQSRVGDVLNPTYLTAYLLGSLAALALVHAVARRALKLEGSTSVFCAMGSSCSNSSFVGYPILLLSLPGVASTAFALNLVIENMVMIPLLLFMAERAKGGHPSAWAAVQQALARLAVNPLVLALVAGMVVSLTGWVLPAPVVRTVDMLAVASGAVSLLVIGGTLVGLPLRGLAWRVAPLALAKLLLHPLWVWAMLGLVVWAGLPPLEAPLAAAAVLLAAMPMMGIYPTLAQAHGQDDWAAVALVVTTTSSFFTLTALMWWLLG